MQEVITRDIQNILIPRVIATLPERLAALFQNGYRLLVNPTGCFVIGGPHGDTGLTGRKIIVDTYGGKGAHGGGAFSGKDSSKVDRSAAYAARHIAKNLVAAGVADEVLVQVAYAIGVKDPVGLYVKTFGTARVGLTDGEISRIVAGLFDMTPHAIVKRFGLKDPVFRKTTTYGHFGRTPHTGEVEVPQKQEGSYERMEDGKLRHFKKVEYFAWEKLDRVDDIREAFGMGQR